MSQPQAKSRPPPSPTRGIKALICPQCRTRFDDTGATGTVIPTCSRDGTPLVRISDLADAHGGDPMLGRTLDGRFTILAKLGAGSMGTVYRARQHAMGRDVAIKILRSDRSLDEQAKGRFLREARANSLLASPHTVTVFDFGQAASGELFLAMELLEGESVGQRISRTGRLRPELALDTCRQALRSLGEAHAKGIIHRDLKPDNLFYARVVGGGPNEEIVKVLDFGIAKVLGDTRDPMNAVETQAGTVFGTPRYMSPEQAQGKPLDGRSDLYALGVILYHMLTGRPPFTDDDAIVVMARHIKTAPPSFATVAPDLKLVPDLESLVMRLLAKDANARPASTEALLAEIGRLSDSNMSVTSGVRVSVSTSPPLKVSEASKSVTTDGWSTSPEEAPRAKEAHRAPGPDTLELAGVPRGKTSWAVMAIVALAVCGASAFAAREVIESRRQVEAAPTPTITATTAAPGTARTDIPPVEPDPTTSAGAASGTGTSPGEAASSSIPSISADQLPKAPLPPTAVGSRKGSHPSAKGAASPASASPSHPSAAPTASQGYGLLE